MSASARPIGKTATRNSLYSMGASLWYLLSRFLLTPFILHYLSMAEYGLWSLCFVVMSFLAMTSMGLEGAYIKYTAEFNARNEPDRINSLLSTGLLLSSLISLVLLVALWSGMNLLLDLLDIQTEIRQTAVFIFMGTGVVFMLDISLNGFGRILEGLQHIALVSKVRLASSFIEILLIVVFLLAGYGVYGMMWAFFIRYLLNILINMALAYRLLPTLRVSVRLRDMQSLRLLVNYGGKMQLLGFIGIFMSTYDRLIITRMLGLASAGLYEVGRKIPFTGSRVPAEISGAIMPALSHLQSTDGMGQARALFLQASRYMGMLAAVIFTYLFAVAPQAITVWLGRGYDEAVAVMYVVSAGVLVNLLTGASSAAAKGFARLDWEIRYAVLNLVLCILFTPLFCLWLGLAGAALGVAGSTAIASVYFIVITNRHFSISFVEYWRSVLHPVTACILSGAVVWLFLFFWAGGEELSRVWLAVILCICGVFHLAASTLLLWLSGGVEPDEKGQLRHHFTKLRMRSVS